MDAAGNMKICFYVLHLRRVTGMTVPHTRCINGDPFVTKRNAQCLRSVFQHRPVCGPFSFCMDKHCSQAWQMFFNHVEKYFLKCVPAHGRGAGIRWSLCPSNPNHSVIFWEVCSNALAMFQERWLPSGKAAGRPHSLCHPLQQQHCNTIFQLTQSSDSREQR